MKILTIMRGVSGSGKSTVAKALAVATGATIFSTDALFVGADGVYRFDPKKLGYNHQQNVSLVETAMIDGVEKIIVDNTNTMRSEMKPYVELAQKYGYNVQYVSVERDVDTCISQNQHGVPSEAIHRMKSRFQYENKVSNGQG